VLLLLLLLLQDLAEAGRAQGEFQAKMEKMMGQVIAADTTKEHYRQKVSSADRTALQQPWQDASRLLRALLFCCSADIVCII
jgi:hypothetical protein